MNGSSSSDMMAGLAGLLGAGVVAIILIVSIALALALTVFIIIVNWKLFEKAGEPGWKAIIPFYNLYTMCDISMTKPTSIVVFVVYMVAYAGIPLTLIPYLGIVVSLVISPIMYITAGVMNFAIPKAYGKDVGMSVLSIFFPPIVRAILAFSKDTEYTGTKLTIIPESK